MNKNNCPSYQAPAFSSRQKLWISPFRKIQCGSCSAYVGVSKPRSLLLLLFSQVGGFLFAVIGFNIGKSGGMAMAAIGTLIGLVAAFAFLIWLHDRFVPFEIKRT